jgi:hypothetical protein
VKAKGWPVYARRERAITKAAARAEIKRMRLDCIARNEANPAPPAEHTEIVRAAGRLFGSLTRSRELGAPRALLETEALRNRICRQQEERKRDQQAD